YLTTRDIISYAITKEAEAGRATTSGGVFLSFEHLLEEELRSAFGPVIDRLAANGIDLTKRPIEVAPIAHYHMGGIRVNSRMETRVLGLYAAGEAVGGANGANRLSGNALVEAFVFGERAGRFSAIYATGKQRGWSNKSGIRHLDSLNNLISCKHSDDGEHAELGQIWAELQNLMWINVGVLRTGLKLEKTLLRLRSIRANLE
ncbi:MAG TPA: FAD-binding protein, partial [Rhodospirillales bacterium]|nr:FAD-binding protein [Rhodospirillales bacterium]